MICVSIADVTVDEALQIISGSEISEVRLDLLKHGRADIKRLFASKQKTVATYRPGGDISETDRLEVLTEAVNSGATYVDIEVESDDRFKKELVQAAKGKGCKTIVSYHNYTKTPVISELEQIMDWCFECGADYAKIACHVESVEECSRLLSLYSYGRPVIAIGMGEAGRITRIAAPLLGAPFTYASIDDAKKTAPGQFNLEKLRSIIEMIRNP